MNGVQFSLESLWAMEPTAFEHLRSLVVGSSHERLAAAVPHTAGITSPDTLYENSGGVAVIPFKGVVAKNETIWSQIFGGNAITSDLVKAVDAARIDPAVESALLVIDSPGGTVDGTSDAADAVAALNAVKPVTTYADGNMSSAAYWIGSQASRLVGSKTAHAGSIGVFSTVPDFSRMAKNAGIDVNVIKSASAKGIGTPGAPVTEDQLTEVQRLVDATHQLFVGAVSRGRGKNMAHVADGRVHIGQAAVDVGLLDAIEPLSTTLAAMQEAAKPKPMMEAPMPETNVTSTPAAAPAPDYSKDITDLKSRFAAQDTELAKVRAAHDALDASMKIDAMIADADPRKLTPGLVPTARTIAEHGGVDALKGFLASLPTSAPDGGSVQDSEKPEDATPRNAADYVGGSLRAYDQTNVSAHQKAIAFKDKAEASGKKISYRDALIAVTRK
jgi:signal peptide peptidase SppA